MKAVILNGPKSCPECGTPKKSTMVLHAPYDHDWDRRIDFGCGTHVIRFKTMIADDEGHHEQCEPYWSQPQARTTSCYHAQMIVLKAQVHNLKLQVEHPAKQTPPPDSSRTVLSQR